MEHKPLLQPGCKYHIYNRGINKGALFITEDDFRQFIHLMGIYLPPVADVYSYALMTNHFHVALRLKPTEEIGWLNPENASNINPQIKWSTTFDSPNSSNAKKPSGDKMIYHLLSAYAKWFNTKYKRSGRLFEERFERKEINDDDHLRQEIAYINRNPEKHGISAFDQYPWTSFLHLKSGNCDWLCREAVLKLFGALEMFDLKLRTFDPKDISSSARWG